MVMGRLIDALGGMRGRARSLPDPGRRVWMIGDVHGRHDLLEPLLDRIAQDVARHSDAQPAVVTMGDYVDRGDRSADVLATLRALPDRLRAEVVVLMGNHERMMLDTLDDPVANGHRWLRNGGVETLASFGVGGVRADLGPAEMRTLGTDLRAAMPAGLEAWMRGLPTVWRSGTLVCVHAALDPARPPEAQDEDVLLWGHRAFARTARRDGLWVAHGHTIVAEPVAQAGRIALDTGAYRTGQLTAAVVGPGAGDVAFVA